MEQGQIKDFFTAPPTPLRSMKTMKWCQMSNIPLATGYSPISGRGDAAEDGERMEIGETETNINTHPKFNMNNRRIGRATMKLAEERGPTAEEQVGSRKRRSAKKHALNERL